MSPLQKLLIVIDPTADSHPALDRTCDRITANQPQYAPEITILFAHDASSSDSNEGSVTNYSQADLLHLISPLTQLGVSADMIFNWSSTWADSIIKCAEKTEATSILVSNPGKHATKNISDEFWHLIRHAKVPVAILQSRPPQTEDRIILASMDLQDNKLEGLNQRIFDTAKALSGIFKADLHLANAYGSSTNYPDRARIVALTGLPNENIHLKAGEPDEALREITQSFSPNLIVIGATRRTGIRATLRGRKIGQILKTIDQDLLVVA